MGKRMGKKLKSYKKDWDKDMWEKNLDIKQDRKYRKERGPINSFSQKILTDEDQKVKGGEKN